MTDAKRTLTHSVTGGVIVVADLPETLDAYEGLGWEPVGDAVASGKGPKKADLLAAAERAEVDVPESATKAEIAAALDASHEEK